MAILALAGQAQARVPAAEQASVARALQHYAAVQMRNADRPEGRLSLAGLYAAQGDPARALAEACRALDIDPTSVEARVVAVVKRLRGFNKVRYRGVTKNAAHAPTPNSRQSPRSASRGWPG